MTDFTANSAPSDHKLSEIFGGIGRFFASLSGGFRAYRTYVELERMTNLQLADLGLSRIDLPRAAAAHLFVR